MFSRRIFLRDSAVAMFGLGSVPLWLSRAAYGQTKSGTRGKVLVVIFQRGAVDGLNVVAPHGDAAYYAMRPTIALPRPDGTEKSLIDLDGHFGLHPSLRSLQPLWDRQQLAIVHAAGSPDPTRSHFDAQDYMESGTPGRRATVDGWLNRALGDEPASSRVRAVSFTADLPLSLRGHNHALSMSTVNEFQIRDAAAASMFSDMYGHSNDQIFSSSSRETFEAMKLLQAVAKSSKATERPGARYPGGRLGQSLEQIALLIKADVGMQVAFTDVGGWDTHVNEVGPEPHVGQLARLLREMSESLAAFSQDMADRMEDITVVTMSEFGRTAHENGTRGTDHGHANVMFVLGGGVRGGKVYGDWPGLAAEQLYEGRDLNVTTDFRTVLAELVEKQVGNQHLGQVFPGYQAQTFRGIML